MINNYWELSNLIIFLGLALDSCITVLEKKTNWKTYQLPILI